MSAKSSATVLSAGGLSYFSRAGSSPAPLTSFTSAIVRREHASAWVIWLKTDELGRVNGICNDSTMAHSGSVALFKAASGAMRDAHGRKHIIMGAVRAMTVANGRRAHHGGLDQARFSRS